MRPRARRDLLLKALIGITVLAAAAWLLARSVDVKALAQSVLAIVRAAGPVTFFLAMALLPALGAPLSLFTLTAGPLFSMQLGMPLVATLAFAAIAINVALSYVLANRALRPLLEWIVKRLGYRLPAVDLADANDLILLLRVTPGVPFPIQNYLLGLADVPFLRYLVLSCLIAFPMAAAFLFLGEALLHGRGRMALLAVMLFLATMVAIQFFRRRLRGRGSRPA